VFSTRLPLRREGQADAQLAHLASAVHGTGRHLPKVRLRAAMEWPPQSPAGVRDAGMVHLPDRGEGWRKPRPSDQLRRGNGLQHRLPGCESRRLKEIADDKHENGPVGRGRRFGHPLDGAARPEPRRSCTPLGVGLSATRQPSPPRAVLRLLARRPTGEWHVACVDASVRYLLGPIEFDETKAILSVTTARDSRSKRLRADGPSSRACDGITSSVCRSCVSRSSRYCAWP